MQGQTNKVVRFGQSLGLKFGDHLGLTPALVGHIIKFKTRAQNFERFSKHIYLTTG